MNHKFRNALTLLFCLLSILLIGIGVASVSAQTGDLCHVPPGNPENAQIISVGDPAYASHLAQHEDDFIIDGSHPCPPEDDEDPVDVCPNLDGAQATVPDGYHLSEGQCVEDEDPVDVCPNLEGAQAVVPDGYHFDNAGNCVPDEEECPESNLSAVVDNCEEETDYCPNLEGIQESVPDGNIVTVRGECVPEEQEEASAPAALSQTCVDVFHPFIATNPEGFDPTARGYLVQNTSWAGYNTDLVPAWYVWLDIVPEIRDSVRLGNDAGILCADAIPAGPQIIAFRVIEVNDLGVEVEVTAGLVLVHTIDDSIVIDAATILRGDILSRDLRYGGAWE